MIVPITVLGQTLDASASAFVAGSTLDFDVEALRGLRSLPRLSAVSFCDHPVDDVGLGYLCDIPTLENIALQAAQISDAGLAQLARLPRLRHLRLKDNPQLTDACAPHLARLTGLEDLQLHETSITAHGLAQLVGLGQLRDLLVDIGDDDLARASLLALSRAMPRCEILVKGKGVFLDGGFDGTW